MSVNGMNGMGKSETVHTVIGRYNGGRILLYSRAYGVTNLVPGYIVNVGGTYYRVYEDGRRGLRYWNVDDDVREKLEALALVGVA